MKKFYTVIGAMLITAGASAQYAKMSNQHEVTKGNELRSNRANSQVTDVNADRGTVHWSDDFTGGANWTASTGPSHTVSGTNPGWEIVTAMPSTLTGQGSDATLNSTSGGDFAIIDSDAAGGSATQDAYYTWSGTAIDLTLAGTGDLLFEFENYHRIFYETHTVGISVDGGTTWTDYEVNTQYGADVNNYQPMPGSNNPEVVSVNVSALFNNHLGGGGLLNNIAVRFHYQGQWDWWWAVDDARFTDLPNNEAHLISGRVGSATADPIWGDHLNYYIVPTSQIDPAGYLAYGTAVNEGALDQSNGTINCTVDDGATQTNLTGQFPMATWTAGDTLRDTTNAFNPAATGSNTYSFDIFTTYDNVALDADPSNNNEMWEMKTEDDSGPGLYEYGRTPGDVVVSGTWNGDDGGSPASAYPYTVGTMLVPNATMDIGKVRVAFHPNTLAGGIVYPVIIEMDPNAADFQSLFASTIYDGSAVANGEYTVQQADISGANAVWVDLPLQSTVTLNAGTAYVVGFGYYGGPETVVVATNSTYPASEATNFIYDAVGNNSQSSIQWFYTASAQMIRAVTPSDVSIAEQDNGNIVLGQNIPNPTAGTTKIPYEIMEAGDVSLDIVDITGKMVTSIDKGTQVAGKYSFQINADELSEGVYFYTMTVGQDRVTKRMVVTK